MNIAERGIQLREGIKQTTELTIQQIGEGFNQTAKGVVGVERTMHQLREGIKQTTELTIQQIGEGIFQTAVGRVIIDIKGSEIFEDMKDQGFIFAFCPHKSHADERIVFEVLRKLGLLKLKKLIVPGKRERWFTQKLIRLRNGLKHPRRLKDDILHNLHIKYIPEMAFPGCEIVPISDNRRDIINIIKMMKKNTIYSLLVAPQGSRYAGDDEMYEGVAWISFQTGLSIIPIGLIGTGDLLPKGSFIPQHLIRRKMVSVIFGQPINPADYNNNRNELMQVLKERYLQMDLE